MAHSQETWAEAEKRRKKDAWPYAKRTAACALVTVGTGTASAYCAHQALKEWQYAQTLDSIGGIERVVHKNLDQNIADTRQDATKWGVASSVALAATCVLAVGTTRLYRRFWDKYALVREARRGM